VSTLRKNFLLGLKRIKKGILETLACLLDFKDSFLSLVMTFGALGLNCEATQCLKEKLSLQAISLFHPDLYIEEIKS